MTELKNLWRVFIRPEVWSICVVVFAADLVAGIIVPTFSLFATGLGASLALVGALTGMAGLTSIFASIPIGLLSDTQGRKKIISAGMLLLAISSFLNTLVQLPVLLFPIRILMSLGMIGVFMVGIAYVGDVVKRADRGIALGLYSTGMALGFTVGPAIGGFVAEALDYHAAYRIAALIALIGFVVAVIWLADSSSQIVSKSPSKLATQRSSFAAKLRIMGQDRQMLAGSLANLGNNVAFNTIFSFLPLYAASIAIGDATLGTIFAIRGVASTLSRIPTGMVTARLTGRTLMLAGLLLSAIVLFGIGRTISPMLIALLLIGDGIAYGMFLTAGQSYITEIAVEDDRGSAVGVYTMAGSIGAAAGPVILGGIAEWLGLEAVFSLSAALVLMTALVLRVLGRPQNYPPTSDVQPSSTTISS